METTIGLESSFSGFKLSADSDWYVFGFSIKLTEHVTPLSAMRSSFSPSTSDIWTQCFSVRPLARFTLQNVKKKKKKKLICKFVAKDGSKINDERHLDLVF